MGIYRLIRPYYRHLENSHRYTSMQNTYLSKNSEKSLVKGPKMKKKQQRSLSQALTHCTTPNHSCPATRALRGHS
jgi:hypothetical protein